MGKDIKRSDRMRSFSTFWPLNLTTCRPSEHLDLCCTWNHLIDYSRFTKLLLQFSTKMQQIWPMMWQKKIGREIFRLMSLTYCLTNECILVIWNECDNVIFFLNYVLPVILTFSVAIEPFQNRMVTLRNIFWPLFPIIWFLLFSCLV